MQSEFDVDLSAVAPMRSVDQVHDDMLQVIRENDPETNTAVGEPVWDATRATATVAAALSADIGYAIRAAIPQMSYGGYLDQHAIDVLPEGRKPGVKAKLTVTLTSQSVITIPQGTVVYTAGDLLYTLDTSVSIVPAAVQPDAAYIAPGSATTTATAVEIGAVYNVVPGAINTVDGDYQDIVTVSNGSILTQGVDRESDVDLKARMLLAGRNRSGAGNPEDYKSWALQAVGITNAKIFRADPSPGSVTIVVVSESGIPTAEQIASAQTIVDKKANLLSKNYVQAPVPLPIAVSANVTTDEEGTLADVKLSFEQDLYEYLAARALTGEVIRYAQIFNLLIDQPNVIDVESLLINNGTANITPTAKAIATLGTVTLV